MITEIHTLGQENVFSCTMDDSCKVAFPIIQKELPAVQMYKETFVCMWYVIMLQDHQ
jgi:hypothetical protein